MSYPQVTVITPTFNRAKIIPTAIKSVLEQTYANFEYIIVGDGCTDKTEKIVRSFRDKRIKYIKNFHKKGPAGARNTALEVAKGKWITYLDDDDKWYKNLLKIMVKEVSSSKNTVFAAPRGKKTLELYKNNKLVKKIENSNNYPINMTVKDIAHKTFHFDNIGFFHSKTTVEEGIKFDENEKLGALKDWEFALQLCEKYPFGFLAVKNILFHYHQRFGTDGRVSNDTYEKTAVAFEYVYQKHKNDIILEGQKWYPQRIKKYERLQRDFRLGIVPPKYMLPFL